jgi:hypothetical protein
MSKLLESDLVLMGPTKYLCGDCTIGGALTNLNNGIFVYVHIQIR